MAYTKRQTRFTLQHIQQNLGTGLNEKDERTLMEKAQDDQIAMDRLTINSALSNKASFQFVAEMDAAEGRDARQAVIEKWRAYAVLEVAHGDYLAHGETARICRYRLSKAVADAEAAGWVIERSKYGQLEGVRWPK